MFKEKEGLIEFYGEILGIMLGVCLFGFVLGFFIGWIYSFPLSLILYDVGRVLKKWLE